MASTEEGWVRWLRRLTGADGRSAASLIGDDAAFLPAESWAVTNDTQIAGVHFPPWLEPQRVAERLLAVNLSDLAAVGATPAFAFLALAAPPGFDSRRFVASLVHAGRRHDVVLAGGDVARADQLTAALTLLGRRAGRRWLRRDTARPGHVLWLGGTVGEAALGFRLVERGARPRGRGVELPLDLSSKAAEDARRAVRRWLLPEAQLELGRWLGGRSEGAAIDVSDGLAKDLHRLCTASGVGAEVTLAELPMASSAETLGRALDRDPRRLALAGGEDYVLLFSLPPGVDPPLRFSCQPIGRVTQRRTIDQINADGSRETLPPAGWDHLAGD